MVFAAAVPMLDDLSIPTECRENLSVRLTSSCYALWKGPAESPTSSTSQKPVCVSRPVAPAPFLSLLFAAPSFPEKSSTSLHVRSRCTPLIDRFACVEQIAIVKLGDSPRDGKPFVCHERRISWWSRRGGTVFTYVPSTLRLEFRSQFRDLKFSFQRRERERFSYLYTVNFVYDGPECCIFDEEILRNVCFSEEGTKRRRESRVKFCRVFVASYDGEDNFPLKIIKFSIQHEN